MPKKTVIVPVQFAIAVECEYTDEGVLLGTVSSFHPVNSQADDTERPGDEDAWNACLEIPPLDDHQGPCEEWPDYQEAVRQRLSMELSRPIWWDGEKDGE